MPLRWLALCLAFAADAGPTLAQAAPGSAEELFRAGEYEVAAERWRAAASAGSTEATFRLAQMSDLGLGMPRDPQEALRGYVSAGLDGHPAAQFNAGAMFRIGSDGPRDARRAAFWYSLAAANDHVQSAYDLARAFARGDGVPRNIDLARYWLDQAAPRLEAAAREQARIGQDAPDARRIASPEILGANVVRRRDGWRIALAWAAPPGPAGSLFLVELAAGAGQAGGGGRTVMARETEASVAGFEVVEDPVGLVWRVSRVAADRSDYAASPWVPVASSAGDRTDPLASPKDRVAIRFGGTDPAARRLASELSRTLSEGGVWARVERLAVDPADSGVRYRYANDALLAADVATALPVLGAEAAERTDDPGALPGEVVVTLQGGPAAP